MQEKNILSQYEMLSASEKKSVLRFSRLLQRQQVACIETSRYYFKMPEKAKALSRVIYHSVEALSVDPELLGNGEQLHIG